MNGAYISAFAALVGSAVGALASFATTWVTVNAQERANRLAQAMSRKETLYGQFIEEASKLFTHALTHKLDDASRLVHLYALISKLRLFASPNVLSSAEEVARRIVDTYDKPDVDVHAAITAQDAHDFDILLSFSEICRRDMAMEHGTNLGRDGRHSNGARNERRQSLLA
jgi:hypothetical protein